MAAAVVCDCCRAVTTPKDAKHVRIYKLATATTYDPHHVKDTADICDTCYHKIRQMLNLEVCVDAD